MKKSSGRCKLIVNVSINHILRLRFDLELKFELVRSLSEIEFVVASTFKYVECSPSKLENFLYLAYCCRCELKFIVDGSSIFLWLDIWNKIVNLFKMDISNSRTYWFLSRSAFEFKSRVSFEDVLVFIWFVVRGLASAKESIYKLISSYNYDYELPVNVIEAFDESFNITWCVCCWECCSA